jgi:hypothetical protein
MQDAMSATNEMVPALAQRLAAIGPVTLHHLLSPEICGKTLTELGLYVAQQHTSLELSEGALLILVAAYLRQSHCQAQLAFLTNSTVKPHLEAMAVYLASVGGHVPELAKLLLVQEGHARSGNPRWVDVNGLSVLISFDTERVRPRPPIEQPVQFSGCPSVPAHIRLAASRPSSHHLPRHGNGIPAWQIAAQGGNVQTRTTA